MEHLPSLRTLVLLVALCVSVVAEAGSATAKLICRSASGRTTFTANLQDIDGEFEGGTLTIDGMTLQFGPQDGDDCFETVWDPAIGVFTVTFKHDTPEGPVWFRFWAVPSTFKTLGSSEDAMYQFEGVIEASEPRPEKGLSTPRIRMMCHIEYHI